MSGNIHGVANPKAKLTPAKVRRIRERHNAGKGEAVVHLASEYGVTPGTIGQIVTGRIWCDVGGLVRPVRDHRLSHRGVAFCPVDGWELEHATNDGVLVIRCAACDRRRAGRCIDCGARVQGKAWRCEPHRIAAQQRGFRGYVLRNRELLARRALRYLHSLPAAERRRLREYKKTWRRSNPRKVYAQKRRARLRGNGGWATREKYLAYHRAYYQRRKVAA